MIIASDFHIRRTPPRARIDDYWAAQDWKLRFILEQAKSSPPLLVAGDFFHQAKPGPFLEQYVISLLREYEVKPLVVPGQHDLPGHSLQQVNDSGLGVLAAADAIELMLREPETICWSSFNYSIVGVPYGEVPPEKWEFTQNNTRTKVLLWHHMVINEPLWPGQVADRANAVLKKYPQFDIIVTGDNHQSFVISDKKGRQLINPGSMMRMTAIQANHKPCIFRWENNTLEQILLPIEDNVFDLSELEQVKEKDERISAFVERLDKQWESGMSFEKNLENYFKANDTPATVRELVWGCLK